MHSPNWRRFQSLLIFAPAPRLQCAHCHDSPVVDDFKQEHYFGILAHLNRSYLFPNAQAPTAVITEKAEGEVSFMSVFDKNKAQKSTGPKMPNGKPAAEPRFDKGKEYKLAPAKNIKPIPAYSRRARLADDIVASEYFRRNAVIQPLEFDHSNNPPSHPELLKILADEFSAHQFDIKWLVKEIALSHTYQRSSELPPALKEAPAGRYLVGILKPLAPEQFGYAIMQATGLTDSERNFLGKNDTDAALNARLAPQMPAFVRMFGSQPGQPEDGFQTTLDQTLFLKHGGLIRGFIAARAGNLLDRTAKIADSNAVADELFLSIFTRPASDEEQKDIAELLKNAKDRNGILSETIWGMVASAEFRFNH